MVKNILVALDNSDFANKVMEQAVDLAKVYGAKLTAVSVVDYSVIAWVDESGVVVMPDVLDAIKRSFEVRLDACRELAEKAGVQFEQKTLSGNPGAAILNYADENGIDLVVVGHIGKSAAANFLMGSVAHKVTNYAKCSVLVVK